MSDYSGGQNYSEIGRRVAGAMDEWAGNGDASPMAGAGNPMALGSPAATAFNGQSSGQTGGNDATGSGNISTQYSEGVGGLIKNSNIKAPTLPSAPPGTITRTTPGAPGSFNPGTATSKGRVSDVRAKYDVKDLSARLDGVNAYLKGGK